jgi:TatD DNase family protein
MLVDTHCHIHESHYPLDVGDVMQHAHAAGVSKLICVGTSEQSSVEAVAFAAQHEHCYASVGVHPHDTKEMIDSSWKMEFSNLLKANSPIPNSRSNIVAIGEIGLDYFYTHSPREVQIAALESQLQLARDNNLPVIFHVREAFDDFWPIVDNFSGLRGELHSFTDSHQNLEQALERGLYIGVNGISTFTKDDEQQKTFDLVPLDNLLLETDAPFLTPVPYRGKVNQPAYVRVIAEYHAQRRHISLKEIAAATTANATALFAL